MKKFNFRLQRVLDIKNTIEQVKKRDFDEANAVLTKEKKLLKGVTARRVEYAGKVNDFKKINKMPEFIVLYYNYLISLSQRQLFHNKKISMATAEVEKRRTILLTAVRERKAIELVKEKKIEEYNLEVNLDEQNQLDEIAGMNLLNKLSAKVG